MTLATGEFIRRFLLHVLPRGFHRIRHYGLLASTGRKANLAKARELLAVPAPSATEEPTKPPDHRPPCPCCGGHDTSDLVNELRLMNVRPHVAQRLRRSAIDRRTTRHPCRACDGSSGMPGFR